MSISFEIRVCQSCGLRYPIAKGHAFGIRCPHCLGETVVAVHKSMDEESRVRKAPARSLIHPPQQREVGMAVLLDNIRSAWNVGSILRSADGFGFKHAYLCGITPTPDQEAVQKTALGAEEYVTWSHHKDAVKLVKGLKKEGWRIWGMEEDGNALEIRNAGAERQKNINTLLIAGSEVTGIDPELLNLCDEIFFIPMQGQKRSFNVAVAFGVAAYAIMNEG